MRLPLLVVLTLLFPACSGAGGLTATGDDESSTSGGTTGDTPTTGAPTTNPTAVDNCGDNAVDDGETCDGTDLAGKQCSDLDAAYIGGTLACAANCGSFDASGCELDPGAALVVLNELTSKGASEGPVIGDAIELLNAGGAAADLSGWQLSDDPTLPADKTYVFPPGSTLAPGEYLVLSEYDDVAMTGDFPFGISSSNEETITLADAGGVARDTIVVLGSDAVVSYCRLPDGTGAWQVCDPTFGAANSAPSTTCGDGTIEGDEACEPGDVAGQACDTLGLGFTGGTLACSDSCTLDTSMCTTGSALVINELESTNDAIELFNSGADAVDLSGWILTDDLVDQDYDPANDPEKLAFPAQTMLGPGAYLVVAKGVEPNQHPFGLGAEGDTVSLLQPNLMVVDQVAYGLDQALVSYCRLPDGPGGAWTADCTPTPGAANQGP